MSITMPVEAEQFEDQDLDYLPEPVSNQVIDRFVLAHHPTVVDLERGGQDSGWYVNIGHPHVRFLHSEDLFYAALLQHDSFRVARWTERSAVAPRRIAAEAWPAWISTNQLLEWVRLRAENASLRHENEWLRQQLAARAAPPQKAADPDSVVADPTTSLDVCGFRLPPALSGLAGAIEQSRSLLDLEDDWDGEGTRGYAEETWRRAMDFLVRYATVLWEQRGVATEDVEILPDTDGALAIDWRARGRELLIRVPEDPTQDASYYGDDGSGRYKIKGTIDTSTLGQWLVWWLAG